MKILKTTALAAIAAVSVATAASAASYLPTGPQIDVDIATVLGGGWSLCFVDTMDNSFGASAAATLDGCSGGKLLVAGRATGSSTLLVLAQADKVDVLFDTGAADNGVTHVANGTGWYNADNWSFGFAPEGEAVTKYECDTTGGIGRLCLHTLPYAGGYRFNDVFTFGSDYEKLVFTDTGFAAVPEASTWAMLIAGFGLVGATARRRRRALAA